MTASALPERWTRAALQARGETSAIHDALFVLWIATIAADRIDLTGGAAGFLLTPFLALTPIVAASEILRRTLRRRPMVITRSALAFIFVVLALLAVIGASVYVSTDTTTSASRALLLGAQVLGTTTVVLAVFDRSELRFVMDRGAVAGLLLFALFDLLQIAVLLGLVPQLVHFGPATADLMPSTYGGIVPRLSGTVVDQNRAGLVLVFYGWAVAWRRPLRPRRNFLGLIVVLALATLSRSALTTALATITVLALERRLGALTARSLLVACAAIVAVLATLLISPTLRENAGRSLEPLTQRLSFEEGSSQVHFTLIERGFKTGTESVARVFVGLGYGSGFTVLQDVFPGNRYASFHSLYVTMFAECGVFGLLLILVLVVTPLVRGGPYRALVAGAAVFNLFYQATNDPAFWMILAMAWLSIPPRRRLMRRATADPG
ncbi:MAG: hypothetical protein ABIY52_10175 [Gemmatimonadaceae bacterium]